MTDTEKQLLEKVLARVNESLYSLEEEIAEGEELTDEMRTEWEEGYLSGIRITATTIEMIINGEIELEQQPADSK
jgi:hypothetical protein